MIWIIKVNFFSFLQSTENGWEYSIQTTNSNISQQLCQSNRQVLAQVLSIFSGLLQDAGYFELVGKDSWLSATGV